MLLLMQLVLSILGRLCIGLFYFLVSFSSSSFMSLFSILMLSFNLFKSLFVFIIAFLFDSIRFIFCLK